MLFKALAQSGGNHKTQLALPYSVAYCTERSFYTCNKMLSINHILTEYTALSCWSALVLFQHQLRRTHLVSQTEHMATLRKHQLL